MKKLLLPLSLLSLVAACGGQRGDAPRGNLALIVTDAPFAYELVHSATILVDRIAIDAEFADPNGEPRVIYSGSPKPVELTGLRNGKLLHLLDASLPIGSYSRLYLHLAGVRLELVNGRAFDSHDGSLVMPVMDEHGLALDLLTPIALETSDAARLLFDFDLTRSFVPAGNADPLLASSYTFEPVVHFIRPGATGEIRGIVTQANGLGGSTPVAHATVYVLAAGTEEADFAYATTSTDNDGTFVQLGIPAGTYDVRVYKSGQEVVAPGSVVLDNSYTIVDLTLP